MNINGYWSIIDSARNEAAENSQDALLAAVEKKLFDLPSEEIAEWFNLHKHYLMLADNKAVEKAASDCNIYLSDDSFLYFRGWLLSLGKEAFYDILNNPDSLADYVTVSSDARFEGFVYAGHGVYTQKAFQEEYGPEGTKQWKENWFAENPGKGEYAFEWALGAKYDLWEASGRKSLSDEEKSEIENDLFSRSQDNKIEITMLNTEIKPIENVIQDMFPKKTEDYRSLFISIYSGYEWGFGMLPAASEAFHKEMSELFTSAGWERHDPKFLSACPEYSKGNSRLYCHPLEISGACEANLIEEVCSLVSEATQCTVLAAEDRGRIYDISEEQYTDALKTLRKDIEQDLLIEFSNPNIGSDSVCCENVIKKYRVPTLDNQTAMMASTKPYWKYTADVLNDLILQKKIMERPNAHSFSSRSYMTAPEYRKEQKLPALEDQIKKANAKSEKKREIADNKKCHDEPRGF